jgi:rare lipoprotein A
MINAKKIISFISVLCLFLPLQGYKAIDTGVQQTPKKEQSVTQFSSFTYEEDSKKKTIIYSKGLPILLIEGDNQESLTKQYIKLFEESTLSGKVDSINLRYISKNKYELSLDGNTVILNNTDITPAIELPNIKPEEGVLLIANRLANQYSAQETVTIEGKPEPIKEEPNLTKVVSTSQGGASWYGPGFHGRRTASGARFDQNAMTAAHKTLPFGTKVRVTNIRNGRSVIVTINDRGPYAHNRVIDLSKGSAQQIGLISAGTGTVKLEILSKE